MTRKPLSKAILTQYSGNIALLLALTIGSIFTVKAEDVHFSFSGAGETKAMTHWGVDTAWPSADNVRQTLYHMGIEQTDVVRLNFFTDEALDEHGNIGTHSKERIDRQLALAAMAGDKPLALLPSSEDGTDPSFLDENGIAIPEKWLALLEAAQRYIAKPIHALEIYNEPDYWAGMGPVDTLRDIMLLVKDSPNFIGTELHAASTLCSCVAQQWYDPVSDLASHGTAHALAGSSDDYINFILHVQEQGGIAYNPELHSMAEVLFGAEYGMQGGIWWADALLPRGLLVNAVQGKRLGYAELRWTDSAAAVYRAPNGEVYGFAGSFERSGANKSYRLISDDQDLYFNGVGPLREYMMTTSKDQQGGVTHIDNTPDLPALDGQRWKIVNKAGDHVLEVEGGAPENGANLRTAEDNNALHQKWDISRSRDGYYNLVNASTGKAADDFAWSLEDGGNISQWDNYTTLNQKWWLEAAEDGYFYVHNGHSNLYMEDIKTSTNNVQQSEFNNSDRQQWKFVLVDDEVRGSLVAHYAFDGNTDDSTGANNATPVGSNWGYSEGSIGQSIDLNGGWDWWGDNVALPDDVANSDDITVATWVYWEGGNAFQRIFDFGVKNPNGDPERYMMLTPSDTGGHMKFAITTQSWWDEQTMTTAALPQNQWVHVALTIGGNTARLYVNGELQVAGEIFINPSTLFDVAENSVQQNFIGRSQWGDPTFVGKIDDFQLYNYALNAAEISALIPTTLPATKPIASALATPEMLTRGDTVYLDGSASYDPDNSPHPLSYEWELLSRPQGSVTTLNGLDSATANFVADKAGPYHVQLTISDGESTEVADLQLLVEDVPLQVCDVNGDFYIDTNDISAIIAKLNTAATESDRADWDQNAIINGLDARGCMLQCSQSRCAISN